MGKLTVGCQILPQWGAMEDMRRAWMAAEELGVDALYSADHFFPQLLNTDAAVDDVKPQTPDGNNFEGTTVMAAMAATTTRPEIGCLVQANSYRNPNLTADIARTIDHISNGRFVLGIGSGFQERDYVEYGYPLGTTKSRLLDLARDLPIIKARLERLTPRPIRKIPILIASMGETIGMRLVAQYADRWNAFGKPEKVLHKVEVLRTLCLEIQRDFKEIELTTYYLPHLLKAKDADPDAYREIGFSHLIYPCQGPEWDPGPMRELVAWRDSVNK